MKRLLLSMLLSVVSFSLWAAVDDVFSAVNNDGVRIWYRVCSQNECMVIAPTDGTTYSGEIVIPDSVTNSEKKYPVVSIGWQSFKGCEVISVTIPRTVWTIEANAFEDAKLLEHISPADGERGNVGYLGAYAFAGCENLKGELKIFNDYLPWIREYAFKDCKKITGIILSKDLEIIDHHAFSHCESLKNISFSEDNKVKSIELNAFEHCYSLEAITIPSGVTTIRPNAFQDCVNIKSVDIHDGVVEIERRAFAGCLKLEEVNVPASVKKIGDTAFGWCKSLKEVTLHEGLEMIEGGAFRECGFTSIVIPQSVTRTGTEVFNGCEYLTSIVLPEQLNKIEWGIFMNCTSLASIKIPESVTWICSRAFQGCSALTSIVLPEGVDFIDQFSFDGCTSLTSINFPASVRTIDVGAFQNCTGLSRIICEGETLPTCKEDAFKEVPTKCTLYATTNSKEPWNMFTFDGSTKFVSNIDLGAEEIKLIKTDKVTESMTMVATVNSNATNKSLNWTSSNTDIAIVSDKGKITAVSAGSTEIFATAADGSGKFAKLKVVVADDKTYDFKTDGIYYKIFDNNALDVARRDNNYNTYTGTVVVPQNVSFGGKRYTVTRVGQFAFSNSLGLTNVELPETVGAIDVGGFKGCRDLKSVNLNYIGWYGESALEDCSSLTGEIRINRWVDWIRENAFRGCSGITSVVFEKDGSNWNLKKIDSYAFAYCYNLHTIEIPNTVNVIENAAFMDCWSLGSINIPEGVTTIRSNTFGGCGSLTSVTIPESVTEIGLFAFHASGLTSIRIPGNVKTIVDNAFLDCRNLASVEIEDGVTEIGGCNFMNTKIREIVIPNSVVRIDGGIFNGCTELERVVLSENITEIPCDAFKSDSNLVRINLPSKVRAIRYGAFQHCARLDSIVLPKTVETIEGLAFAGCDSLKTIISLNVNPYWFDKSNTFSDIPDTAKVGVLKEVVDAYKGHDCWNLFGDRIYALATTNTLYSGNSNGVVSEGGLKEAGDLLETETGPNILIFSTEVVNDRSLIPANAVALESNYGRCIASEIALTDAQDFYCPEDFHAETVSYHRTFTKDVWMPFFLPFSLNYDEWKDDVKIAFINNVRQYDVDEDGIIESTVLEFITKTKGSINPHTPYVIKRNNKNIRTVTLTGYDKVVKATPTSDPYINCSSTTIDYKLSGTYKRRTDLHDLGSYGMVDGEFRPFAEKASLSAFRIYLNISDPEAYMGKTRASDLNLGVIYISVDGELQKIEDSDFEVITEGLYDLQGRKVENQKSGFYVKDGKLIYIK